MAKNQMDNIPAGEDMLDAKQAATFLQMHEETLRRLARERKIPSYKVGGSWRFSKSMLYRWAESQQVMPERKLAMIIDDESAIREYVTETLELEGFATQSASRGAEALSMIKRSVPDVILLDLKMPEMDGPTILRHIRESFGQIPVIIITGYPDSTLMAEALKYSPIMLLAKPFYQTNLIQTVKMALGQAE